MLAALQRQHPNSSKAKQQSQQSNKSDSQKSGKSKHMQPPSPSGTKGTMHKSRRKRHNNQQSSSNSNQPSQSPSEPSPSPLTTSSPNQSHHASHSHSRSSAWCFRLQFWGWITCGVVCSFLSIEYSLRKHQQASGGSGRTGNSVGSHSLLEQLSRDQGVANTWLRASTSTATGSSSSSLQEIVHQMVDPAEERYHLPLATPAPHSNPKEHAILIPYRDRSFHLELFQEYMGPYLEKHFPGDNFHLWIVEQDDPELFNRAWLANVGLREITRQRPETSCVIFHDVDLVPNITSHVPYTTCNHPLQLGSELQHFNWTVPYPAYCGGITSLSLQHWHTINGLANDYIGWGGEDDDLYHRLRLNGLLRQALAPPGADARGKPHPRPQPVPYRPPKGHGVYRTLSQKAEHHEQTKSHNNYAKTLGLLREMADNSDRWKWDGLNDAYYTLTSSHLISQRGFAVVHHLKAKAEKTQTGVVQYRASEVDQRQKDMRNKLTSLEFVHIPLTGGQAMTTAGSNAGLVWGACHYDAFEEWNCPKDGRSGDKRFAPFTALASYNAAKRPWQIPLTQFAENPLEGTKRFTVVRHPYSRAIAFYRRTYDVQHGHPDGYRYHHNATFMEQYADHPPATFAQYLMDREDPQKLNQFLQEYLVRVQEPHHPNSVHLIPQIKYVYHRGMKLIHHVLHYEFLQRDFSQLMEQYELDVTLPLAPHKKKTKKKKGQAAKRPRRVPEFQARSWWSALKVVGGDAEDLYSDMSIAELEEEYYLGAQDLADVTIAMMNEYFDKDFRKFHYAKIKVNVTTLDEAKRNLTAIVGKAQSIPLNSDVGRQQYHRNQMLGNVGVTAALPQASEMAATLGGGKPPMKPKDKAPQKAPPGDPEKQESMKQLNRQKPSQLEAPPKTAVLDLVNEMKES